MNRRGSPQLVAGSLPLRLSRWPGGLGVAAAVALGADPLSEAGGWLIGEVTVAGFWVSEAGVAAGGSMGLGLAEALAGSPREGVGTSRSKPHLEQNPAPSGSGLPHLAQKFMTHVLSG